MATPKDAVFEMEMESLVHETLGNGSERGGLPPTPPPENPWRRRGIILAFAAVGLLVWRGQRTDVNTQVTNVDRLPPVPVAELPAEQDDLRGANIEVVPRLRVEIPPNAAPPVAAAPVEVPLTETPVEAPVEVAPAEVEAPVETPAEEAPAEAPVEAPPVPAAPIPPAPQLAPLEPLEPEQSGYKHPAEYFSDTYVPRARQDRQLPNAALDQLWGSWKFVDPKARTRPNLAGLYEQYPNRDVPRAAFPPTAWQVDSEYLKDFLAEGVALTERALGAILAEWGHFDPQNDKLEDAMKDDSKEDPAYMFNLNTLAIGTKPPKAHRGNAGYKSENFDARLRRKILHSIMTEDSFRISMGGHSSSAGHGNHFQQSYTMQVQRALEPLFARLGVYHFTRNIGMGGLGTAHNGLGSKSFYGGDNDILIWDSAMTEKSDAIKDLFARGGLLQGEKVALLWNNPDYWAYDAVAQTGTVATGGWGAGVPGIPVTESLEQVETIPYAARWVQCASAVGRECRVSGYNGVCWIDRPDVTPVVEQKKVMGGRAKWHPGNGSHQLSSRFIVYNVIKLIRQALLDWSKMENYALPDEEWHTTAENERIRTLGLNMTGHCVELELPDRACNLPMNGRSEYTPRANPAATSIRSILRPDVEVNDPPPNFYDPPDVYNPAFDPPDDKDVDYVAIIENGNDFLPMTARHEYLLTQIRPPKVERHAPRSNLPAGKGWFYSGVAAADNCDGSYSSFCNRGADKDCLLYAHNDGRGGLYGDGLSGWILMTLSDMQHGLIIVALNEGGAHTNTKTLGWKCENNEANCKNPISDEESNSSEKTPKNQEPCKDYTVEFSVNGKVTTLPSETFKEQIQTIERTVDLSVVLNDENFVPEGQSQDVEFGIRMGGSCGRSNTLKFSFVYWA